MRNWAIWGVTAAMLACGAGAGGGGAELADSNPDSAHVPVLDASDPSTTADAAVPPVIMPPHIDAGSSGDAGSDKDTAVPTITVHGHTVDRAGHPYPGATLAVAGHLVVSDGNGDFVATGVVAPYDLIVMHQGGTSFDAYQGLTRLDPSVVVYGSAGGAWHAASVTGNLTGSIFLPGGYVTSVFVAGGGSEARSDLPIGGIYFSDSVEWFGPSWLTASIYAFQYTKLGSNADRVLAYSALGVHAVNIQQGATVSGGDVQLDPIGSAAISGTVVPSWTAAKMRATLHFTPNADTDVSLEVVASQPPASDLSFVTPDVANGRFAVEVALADANGSFVASMLARDLQSNASNVAFAFPAVPQLNVPSDGALGVTLHDTFEWSSPGASAAYLAVQPVQGPGLTYRIFTSGHTAHLVDLAPFGVAPPTESMSWLAYVVGGITGVDDFAASPSWMNRYSYMGQSQVRTFTCTP